MAKLSVDQALLKARSHAKKGEIEEAQKLYQTVLQAFPQNKRAQQGLAALNTPKQPATTQGPPQEMLDQLVTLYNRGQLEQVIDLALAIIEEYPEAFLVWNILGVANKRLDKTQQALNSFKKVTELNPNYADGYNNLGVCLKDLGNLDEAIEVFQTAISVKPDHADAYYNLGNSLKTQANLKEATNAYKQAVLIKPNYAEAYNMLGSTLLAQSRLDEAIEVYKQAVLLKPNSADAYNYLGVALNGQGKLNEAIASFNKALSLKPDYAEAYNNMGNVLKKQGKLGEAISSYNKALSFKPDYADAYNNMGVALQDQGKFEEAISSYNKALSFKPDYAEAHRHLSSLIKYKPDCTQVALVAEIIERTDLKEDDRCHLHYTFAKMTEDLGDLDTAYDNYVAGGKLRQKLLSYDFKQDELRFEQIKNTAPKLKEFAFKKPIKATTNTPIFILGMPRSGTTLVEQIISSHSQVRGAGELPFLGRFGSSLCYGNQIINLENILKMRNAYLNELIKVSNECPFVTDKTPQNFLFIGLLLKALPEAKVIHVKRDPAATCWSNFKQHFSAKGLGYSYNLKDTVKYFKLYQDLMDFWDEQYSDQIYHLEYDKLTIEQEPETRKLIEYLKLGWEDDCLSPHKNKRSVRTASQKQVREKVYTGSSQAWRKFEPYLNGVFDEIEPSSALPLK